MAAEKSFEEYVGFDNKMWQVHKFGGTSVANADCLVKAASIVEEQINILDNSQEDNGVVPASGVTNLAVVVSAMGGKPKVTDLLLDSVDAAANRDDGMVNEKLNFILEKHSNCLDALQIDAAKSQALKENIKNDIDQIRDILQTVALMKWKA